MFYMTPRDPGGLEMSEHEKFAWSSLVAALFGSHTVKQAAVIWRYRS